METKHFYIWNKNQSHCFSFVQQMLKLLQKLLWNDVNIKRGWILSLTFDLPTNDCISLLHVQDQFHHDRLSIKCRMVLVYGITKFNLLFFNGPGDYWPQSAYINNPFIMASRYCLMLSIVDWLLNLSFT